MYKVTIFDRPLIVPRPRPGHKPNRSSLTPSEKARDESIRRTRNTIYDYALANDFTHFVTFTFNPKKLIVIQSNQPVQPCATGSTARKSIHQISRISLSQSFTKTRPYISTLLLKTTTAT